ncbi:MAG: hypothetical protein IJW62_05205 [Clostridia bacterium]|nr:hypothetical protein [Clostridia bacterium]
MKKFLTLTLAVLMIVCCASCGSDEVKITHGTVEGNVYKSEFTGITFTAPDGWTFLSDEEIAKIYNYAADELVSDKFEDAVANAQSFTEMMATDGTTGSNINIAYESLTASGNTKMSEQDYLDAAMDQLKSMTTMTVELVGTERVTLSGQSYLRAQLNTTASGINMSQYLYVRKISNYMVVTTVTIVKGYEIADIEAMFS